MATKVKASENPTLKQTVLAINGKEYNLHMDFAAIAKAEALLKKEGHQVNLLRALNLSELDATGLAAILYAMLLRDQPKLSYEDVLNLISVDSLGDIFNAVLEAYLAAQKKPDEKESPNA
jgi:DNA-binding cell septation regulator SpoVG